MSKILVVFGATGLQGGSVIDHVLTDAELSRQFKLRAVTRDPSSEKAKSLKDRNIEVVQGDISDRASLDNALSGAHTVFLITTPDFGPSPVQTEFDAAKNVADVSVEKGAQYIIFSTLPSAREHSGGKFTKVTPFDAKAKAESYIRSLPIKSAFYSPGSFMDNYITFNVPRKPSHDSETFVMSLHLSPKTKIPIIDAAGDTGKLIASVLEDPEKYEGTTFSGAERIYTLEEIAAIMGKVAKVDVVYKQISLDEFKARIPFGADVASEALSYFEEFGYYGKDTEKLVASANSIPKQRLTTFEEFLVKHQFSLS